MAEIDLTKATNLTEASQGLEAYFVRWIFTQLRSTTNDPLSQSMAGGTFKEMLDDALADKIAASGGLGLSQEIESQLTGADSASGGFTPPMTLRAKAYQQVGDGVLTFAPVVGGKSSGFGERKDPIEGDVRFHAGVDIAAKIGTPVYSAGPGKVIFAGVNGGYGNCVMVDHGGGLVTRYGHLSAIDVSVGDSVAPGSQVGKVGSTGRSTGPHLHFEVRRDGKAVSPEDEVPALKSSE